MFSVIYGFPRWHSVKNQRADAAICRRCGFDPWVGKIPWRRKWQCIPVLLPGESHRQRSLVGHSPWGHRGSVTAAQPSARIPAVRGT